MNPHSIDEEKQFRKKKSLKDDGKEQKYKKMFEEEQRDKRKFAKNYFDLKKKYDEIREEKEILSFAYDTLTCKLLDDTVEKSKELTVLLNENSKKEVDKEKAQKTSLTKTKIRLIKHLKQNFNLSKKLNYENIEEVFKEKEGENTEIEKLKNEVSHLKSIIEEKSAQLSVKQDEVIELEFTNNHNSGILADKNQQIQELNEKILNYEKTIASQKERSEELIKKNSQLQIQLTITNQTYQERQKKEKQCLKILQNFSQKLKLNNEKVQEFLKEEVENYSSQNSSKMAYQQHLSYVLHLFHKKEELYKEAIQQLREKIKENELRINVQEKKIRHADDFFNDLGQVLSKNDPNEKIIANAKKLADKFVI